MTATQRQRSAKTAAKREALDERELRHRVRPGIRAKLAELMAWHDITEQSEAIQLLIMNAHAAGPEGSTAMLAAPRHVFEVSPSVARMLEQQGRQLAGRMDQAD